MSFVQRSTNLEQAEQTCRQAIEIHERLTGEHPRNLEYRSDLALSLNNLGAIQSHQSNWTEACDAYRRAIEFQGQLCRQAPPVVRYRSDLAISLNNLGQAYRRSAELDNSEVAFDRARLLFRELAADFPSELAYRSSLGVVLNNQAMLLEDADRLEDAVAAYAQAIEQQRAAFDSALSSLPYRNFLSKHYFNYGRVLRRTEKPIEAADIALERRKLWPGHGKHLYEIAAELSQAVEQLVSQQDGSHEKSNSSDLLTSAIERIRQEAITTLRLALDAGYRPEQKLEAIDRFTAIRTHPDFSTLSNFSPSLQ